jgi:hypothetical protein
LTSVGTITSGIWNGTTIGNSYLANPSTTVAGQTCTLGSTCSIAYSNLSSGAPTATNSVLGLVEPDGTTITNSAGAISVTYGTAANTATQGNDSRITGALQKSGGTLTGELVTVASATGGAGLNLPQGTAPTSPNNGDLWTTSGGLYVRIAGSTVGPLAVAGGSGTVNSGTSGQVAYYAGSGAAVSGESLSALLDSSIGSAQGDVLYRGSSSWSVLAPGTSGYFLQTQGSSANPTWAAASGGSGCSTGGSSGNLLTANGSGGCTTDTVTGLTNGALTLGASGTLGSVKMGNATSGFMTIEPATGALGSGIVYIPSNSSSDTIATLGATQTLTATTLASPTFTGTVSGAGTIPLSILATQAANTVLVNATGSTASPTAVGMPSCSTAASALQWATSGGSSAVTCNTSITAAAVPASGLTGSTLASGVTGSSLTAIGTGSATISISGALKVSTRVVSASTDTASATSDYFLCVTYTSTGAVTETLPSSPATGLTLLIKDCGGAAATNNITITPASGNIDGASTYVMSTNYGSVAVTYVNSQWSVN